MAVVDGYAKSYIEAAESNSIITASVIGSALRLYRSGFGGSYVNAGDPRGSPGVDGPPGDVSESDLNDKIDLVVPGAWSSLPLATNWAVFGSSPWVDARYRRNGYRVELDGLIRYTGGGMTPSSNSAITTALPLDYRPVVEHRVLGWPYRGTSATPNIAVPISGILTLYVYYGTLSTDEWISLTGLSYPVEPP